MSTYSALHFSNYLRDLCLALLAKKNPAEAGLIMGLHVNPSILIELHQGDNWLALIAGPNVKLVDVQLPHH